MVPCVLVHNMMQLRGPKGVLEFVRQLQQVLRATNRDDCVLGSHATGTLVVCGGFNGLALGNIDLTCFMRAFVAACHEHRPGNYEQIFDKHRKQHGGFSTPHAHPYQQVSGEHCLASVEQLNLSEGCWADA